MVVGRHAPVIFPWSIAAMKVSPAPTADEVLLGGVEPGLAEDGKGQGVRPRSRST